MARRSVSLKNRRNTLKKKNATLKRKRSRKTCRLKFRLYKNNKFVKYS